MNTSQVNKVDALEIVVSGLILIVGLYLTIEAVLWILHNPEFRRLVQ